MQPEDETVVSKEKGALHTREEWLSPTTGNLGRGSQNHSE